MKYRLHCNDSRCNATWISEIEQEIQIYGAAGRSKMELCPKCGRYDSHYAYKRDLEFIDKSA
jgi:hypothetical protein